MRQAIKQIILNRKWAGSPRLTTQLISWAHLSGWIGKEKLPQTSWLDSLTHIMSNSSCALAIHSIRTDDASQHYVSLGDQNRLGVAYAGESSAAKGRQPRRTVMTSISCNTTSSWDEAPTTPLHDVTFPRPCDVFLLSWRTTEYDV